jgi:ADP-ribose pyrophosphatase YjhB (NUDIX family)
MPKICDHTSVGMFVWKDGKLLLIERQKFPFGFAIPAGHVDGDDSFETAAKRELEEEVGLSGVSLEIIFEGRKENPCRRDGGDWHFWKLYRVEAIGELKRSFNETKGAGWYSMEQIRDLAHKTDRYNNGKISNEEWEKNPGLEPIMYEFFKELKII